LGVFRGGEGRVCKKMKEKVEIMKGFGGLVFFIIQIPPNLGELKNCIGGVWRVLGGLGKFFKPNLCCYNTFKVKKYINHRYLFIILYKTTPKN
jgi:hypothetical protein